MKTSFRWIAGACLVGLTLGFGGCGTTGSKGSPTPPPPPTANSANLSIFATDAAADNVLAFKMDVTSISVTDSAGTSTTLTTTPQTLELRHLQLAPTLALQAANLPSGQYNSINLTVANPELAVFSSTGAVTQVTNAQLASSTVSIPLTNFSLPSGGTQGLALDFDLVNSISQNASGTYVINPVIHPASVNPSSSVMELVDSIGQISSLSTTPSNSFNFQLSSGAATAKVITDTNTVFDGGITAFSGLQAGQFVEIAGMFQSDGSFLAKYVELSAANQGLRVQGIVASVQTNAAGATSLNLVAQN
jgi:Domain of unknown function (DUF4382)/Domain of unknown function (DUF5666)